MTISYFSEANCDFISLGVTLNANDSAIEKAKELDGEHYCEDFFEVYIQLNKTKSKIDYMMVKYPTKNDGWKDIRPLAETEYDMVEDYLRKEELFGE